MWEYYVWFQKQNSHVSQAQCCTDEVTASWFSESWGITALHGKEMLFASQHVFRQLILSLKR